MTEFSNNAAIKFVFYCLILLTLASCKPNSDDLESIYQSKQGSYPLNTKHLNDRQEPIFINQLVNQDSLYLLQHAHNPVQWNAWGKSAFNRARELNRPILLSIGYSTCHWCHVMARESFDNVEIAEFINSHFVPVKVDREEHPDVDELYLTSVRMLSGKAGWPLTAVLTPDGQAFFGGTYFTPQALMKTLARVNDTWIKRQDAVLEQASRLARALDAVNQSLQDTKAINADILNDAARRIQKDLDQQGVGNQFQTQAGFPREPEMIFLLNHSLKSLSTPVLETVTRRLITLAAGGIHDQVGGGFHRYTVDSDWQIPHFEKMLYNQAQMAEAYFSAFQQTGNQGLKQLGEKTFDFMLRDMQAPEGGFFAAIDAESEVTSGIKSEGAFYTWAYDDLASLLNEKELSTAQAILGVSEQGNFNGVNVLQNLHYAAVDVTADQRQTVQAILEKLSLNRQQRKPPLTDTKIITSWNSMAISALASGYTATKAPEYLTASTKAAERIWKESFNKRTGLTRTLPIGNQRVAGTLEDYAYFANALVDLFDITGEKDWLSRAEQITDQMIRRFHDEKTGGFTLSSTIDARKVGLPVMKLVTARDDAVFSGNSIAAQVLARIWRRTGKTNYKEHGARVVAAFSAQILTSPQTLSGMLLAADILNHGETGPRQYAANGKITITTLSDNSKLDNFSLAIEIADGWHINASKVLDDSLIPTTLRIPEELQAIACAQIEKTTFPAGKLVSLGFQDDELLVYEGSVRVDADISRTNSDCTTLAAELRLQACTYEVCQAPQVVQIRKQLHAKQ